LRGKTTRLRESGKRGKKGSGTELGTGLPKLDKEKGPNHSLTREKKREES